MATPDKDAYDVIIIGAGIGGLICGCYLAKAGLKVLIAEQHHIPGGYCTSFRRRGYIFDAAAHSFGGYREGGIIHKVFSDFNLHGRVKITRYDPSDIIISPDHTVRFWSDVGKTIDSLQGAFPHESENIQRFVLFLIHHQPAEFAKLGKMTLQDLLQSYFTDQKLQAVLAFPILGNGDLPPSRIAAFVAAKIYSEFLLDGGYYPDGGMQMLPNAIAQRFKEFGGTLLLSTVVKKIKVTDAAVKGVVLENSEFIRAQCVISNGDAHQTFFKLLGAKHVGREFLDTMAKMIPSQGIFVLYLGINTFSELPEPGTNCWFLPHYDIENMYALSRSEKSKKLPEYYMVRVSPDRKTVLAFVNTPFRNNRFWKQNKNDFMETFIESIEKNTISGLSQHIAHKEAATPATLYRYTLNYRGAAYGWAGLLSQVANRDLMKPPFLEGLYLAGHWTTFGQGIAGVAYVGRSVANLVLRAQAH
jgi:phytoene dehydrogenase-like protein